MLVKIKNKGRWEYGRRIGKEKVSKLLVNERMDRKEYERKMSERLLVDSWRGNKC